MKRIERITYNQLRKSVDYSVINVEVPLTYSHEARQAIHELLTIEKGMYAVCVYWNDTENAYAIHYEPARYEYGIDKRRTQEDMDVDDVVATLTSYDFTWTGYPKQEQEQEEAQQPQQPQQTEDAQQTEQNEMEDNTMLIKTKKIKANGAKNQGYLYMVDVSDGKNIATFVSDGADHIDFAQLGSVMDANGAKYIRDDGHKLCMMPTWYKGGDVARQEAAMLDFIDKVLSMAINVMFADDEGILLYML